MIDVDRRADRGGPASRSTASTRGTRSPGTDDSLPLEERARRHGAYEDWLRSHVVPWIHADCGGAQEIGVTGVSMGAYHAANLTLRRADLFPLALCLSGIYDIARVGWGERGDAVYFNNPIDYVAAPARRAPRLAALAGAPGARRRPRRLGGLDRRARVDPAVRRRCSPGRGSRTSWTSGGEDSPHDWPAWQRQIAHHLPRFALSI